METSDLKNAGKAVVERAAFVARRPFWAIRAQVLTGRELRGLRPKANARAVASPGVLRDDRSSAPFVPPSRHTLRRR